MIVKEYYVENSSLKTAKGYIGTVLTTSGMPKSTGGLLNIAGWFTEFFHGIEK